LGGMTAASIGNDKYCKDAAFSRGIHLFEPRRKSCLKADAEFDRQRKKLL
jgi:hypothetical protein